MKYDIITIKGIVITCRVHPSQLVTLVHVGTMSWSKHNNIYDVTAITVAEREETALHEGTAPK